MDEEIVAQLAALQAEVEVLRAAAAPAEQQQEAVIIVADPEPEPEAASEPEPPVVGPSTWPGPREEEERLVVALFRIANDFRGVFPAQIGVSHARAGKLPREIRRPFP